ncbi:hypothetical protein Tco_0281563 [Tanacetum coccineum]
MLPKFSQIVNRLYAFIYETNHSKSGLGLPSIVALGWDPRYKIWVEDDPDIIHFDNLCDLPLSTSLNDLNNATLHIEGQSTVVDAPPDIIDVPDEDDDIIGDEDALPYDLTDSDVEDHINMSSADVARGRPQTLRSTLHSLTPSGEHTLLMGYSDRRIYEEMKRLEATGEYTEDEINALARGGKLRGHIPGVGRVLPSRATSRPSMPAPDKSLKSMHRKVDFMMSLFRSDSKYSDMFKEFESGGASWSGGCGDDEEGGDDEDGDSDD